MGAEPAPGKQHLCRAETSPCRHRELPTTCVEVGLVTGERKAGNSSGFATTVSQPCDVECSLCKHCTAWWLPQDRGEQVKGYKGLRQSYLLSGESNLVAEPLNGRSPSRVLFFWNEGGLWVLQQGRHTAWLLHSAFRRPSCAWCPLGVLPPCGPAGSPPGWGLPLPHSLAQAVLLPDSPCSNGPSVRGLFLLRPRAP